MVWLTVLFVLPLLFNGTVIHAVVLHSVQCIDYSLFWIKHWLHLCGSMLLLEQDWRRWWIVSALVRSVCSHCGSEKRHLLCLLKCTGRHLHQSLRGLQSLRNIHINLLTCFGMWIAVSVQGGMSTSSTLKKGLSKRSWLVNAANCCKCVNLLYLTFLPLQILMKLLKRFAMMRITVCRSSG